MAKQATKFADDGFSQRLANMLEDQVAKLTPYVEDDVPIPRHEVEEFVWKTVKKIREIIKPDRSDKATKAWLNAKGMLKGLVDFTKFSVIHEDHSCVQDVLEKKVLEELSRYKTFVLTGEVTTKWPPPKLLGETDMICAFDKPCRYVCQYGGDDGGAPRISGHPTPSALLNGEKPEIQIHEYIALKYDFETAQKTREFWKQGLTEVPCPRKCGSCPICAASQTGCCNRLDKETSGVMICAKRLDAFSQIRKQFASEHSLEKDGTEKYYLALVHGEVILPTENIVKHAKHWNHGPEVGGKGDPRARIAVDCVWQKQGAKSVPFESGLGESADNTANGLSCQWAVTFYEPVAWFNDDKDRRYTLLLLQIITGRRHQIRFHCQQIGHVLVGDTRYDDACNDDRDWCSRVFLHSYCTKFREPFTERWFAATSPLPQDLCEVMEKNLYVERVKKPWTGELLKSRRHHPVFKDFMVQYDPNGSLLVTNDAPKLTPEQIAALISKNDAAIAQYSGVKRRRVMVPPENAHIVPRTPPLPVQPVQAAKPVPAQPAQPVAEQPTPMQRHAAPPAAPPGQVSAPQPNQQAQAPPQQVAGAPVAASTGWKRMESRSQKGVYYYWNAASGATQADPPPPWELKESRSKPGVVYYWNTQTGQVSADKPEV